MNSVVLALMIVDGGVLTRQVTFEFSSPTAKSVNVAGTFNQWNKEANPMRRQESQWRAAIDVPVGRHQYKFVIDGNTWRLDPSAESIDDGTGNTNSMLVVLPIGYDSPAKLGDGRITESPVWHPREAPALSYDRGRLHLTLRTRAHDVDAVSFVTPGSPPLPMVASHSDEIFGYHTVDAKWDKRSPFVYRFEIKDGPKTMKMPHDGGWYQVDPERLVSPAPPPWVEQTVFYQIFPDRFGNGNPSNDPDSVENWESGRPTFRNWFGGDLAGVRQHQGHLRELGVGAVYWNPVFASPSNHRYDTTDYLRIDPRLGTNDEFAALTRELEKAGIKTVLDGVFNHTATDFPAFAALLRDQQKAATRDWYTVRSWPVSLGGRPTYESWAGFGAMPKLNHANPAVRRMVREVVEHWQGTAAVHGWRLDVSPEVPMDFWREFRPWVKADPDRWIVGEMWEDASPWLKGDQWDSTMNYQFRNSVLGFVARGTMKPRAFWEDLMRVHHAYGPAVSRNLLNLVSSHDVPRILTECGGDVRLAKLAAMLMFTWVGAPCVYYGDEIGMEGGPDPDNRRPMDWRRATADNTFLRLYQALAELRNGSSALQSGDPALLAADDRARTLVFARVMPEDVRIVAVNRSEKAQPVSFALTPELARCRDVRAARVWACGLTGASVPADQSRLTVELPPLSLVVLAPRPSAGAVSSTRASARPTIDRNPSRLVVEAIHQR
ncbi:MAG: alpha amylase N-terminal ig-like domain-containing protein [Fimbriimonadaceae bacterium]|nr:alpha amylase N-terminal ig-like domain-containing protein [Fimbriimonadaceae bacterium]QYK58811.1 MAG: alpha amylase N-terminal ig-like domain-containing protein [Fimbriimonadaceae bacterium]